MLIKNGKLIKSDGNIKKLVDNTFEVHYLGFIYTNKSQNEEDCIKELLLLLNNNESIDFNILKGIFLICIRNRINGVSYVFTDNSGMYKSYIENNIISSSFLELVDYLNVSVSDLDYESVNEFLHLGFVHSNNTFIKSIKRINFSEVIEWKNGQKNIYNKNLTNIEDKNIELSFEDHFDIFSNAIKRKTISIDLTGGIDSRLVSVLLDYRNLDFEVAISGVNGNQDIEIAQKVSTTLNKKFHVTYHASNSLTESNIYKIFDITDAQIDILNYHRNIQFNEDKKSRGINFQIPGISGELYKDYWWLQDFPLYRKRNSNITKLFSYRIESLPFPHEILGKKIYNHSTKFKKNSIENLKHYNMDYNTQTYDKIYYHYKMQTVGSTYLTIPTNNYATSYAPLMERDIVKVGYNLSRFHRFYSNFHREQITRVNPNVSQIITTEGISCSNHLKEKLNDIPKYLLNKQKRFLKQIFKNVKGKTYFQENPTNYQIYDIVKKMDLLNKQEEILKNNDILNENIRLENLKSEYIGRFLTIGIFINRLQ